MGKAMTKAEFIAHWLDRDADGVSLLEYNYESLGEHESQYRSECAQFGDAGPGQGYRLNEMKRELSKVVARLRAFGCEV